MNELNVKFLEIYERYLEAQRKALEIQLSEIGRQLSTIKTIKKELPAIPNNIETDSVK